jgi:phospholipid-binding lipoprotein MlaA
MVVAVGAAAVASLAGVASANVESNDAFLRTPLQGVEAPAVRPATADPLQPLIAAFAAAERAPAAVQLAEADWDGSLPSLSRARSEVEADDATATLPLGTAGLLEAQSAGVPDAKILPDAVPLAEADPALVFAEPREISPPIGGEEFIEEYDPWEPFNESMFSFNRKLDQFVIKPVARGWDTIVPDRVKLSLRDALDNLGMPRRFVNKLFQLRPKAAGLELTRFLLNTTVGIAGFFDVAKALGMEKSDADTGQTFGVHGAGPGPYLNLPFLPPLTVRDGIGSAVDIALDPFNYVIFPAFALTGIGVAKRINDRALNLELFENIEETVLDLYSAVRNGYLQRRHKAIRDAIQDQPFR